MSISFSTFDIELIGLNHCALFWNGLSNKLLQILLIRNDERSTICLTDQRFKSVWVDGWVLTWSDTASTSSDDWVETILVSCVVNLCGMNWKKLRTLVCVKWLWLYSTFSDQIWLDNNIYNQVSYPVSDTIWANESVGTTDHESLDWTIWTLDGLQTTSSWDNLSVILFISVNKKEVYQYN